MHEEETARLLELLAELVTRSGRTQREVERALGVGHGWLRLLFAGRGLFVRRTIHRERYR